MYGPTLSMNLDLLRGNVEAIVQATAKRGVEIVGVTKASHGSPVIGRALLESGVKVIGESRISNIRTLREGGVECPIMMLRLPSFSEASDVVKYCNVSLNSEISVLKALSDAAVAQKRVHDVILMLEMGDRREGAMPSEIPALCEAILAAPGLNFKGISSNFMCATGVFPTIEKLEELCATAERIEDTYGITLDIISGGNTTSLPLLDDPKFPPRVNQLRVGAAIFLGTPMLNTPWSVPLNDDVFLLTGELIEVKSKPSLPDGVRGPDAFGDKVIFEDRGDRVRGVLNLGRVDMNLDGLVPCADGIEIATASSDHLILDLTHVPDVEVGDSVSFSLNYPSLLQAMLSPSVSKEIVGGDSFHKFPPALL